MESKELRIGNWVNATFQGETEAEQVEDICNGLINPWTHEGIESNMNTYSGIPLTPEILLKAGFEKQDYEDAFWYETEWPTVGVLCTCDEDRGNYVFDENTDTLRIEYLHQLQNLYHSLTGEELTIIL